MSVETLDTRLQNVEQKVDVIYQYVNSKVKPKTDDGDENEERGNWTGRFDFFLSCLGYAVGLGNVWRFPYLCYKNGGGAFFIPYTIMLLIVGIPIFMLELTLGQYTSAGPVTCWKYAPLFTGVGYGMFIVSALVSIYYNMIIAWANYYLFASFTSKLPWSDCDPAWASNLCFDNLKNATGAKSCHEVVRVNALEMTYPTYGEINGTCYNGTEYSKGAVFAIFNSTLSRAALDVEPILPSQEYFDKIATRSFYSDGIGDLGTPQWALVLCYILAFIYIILALSKSIKTSGKVVYFTATFPYVVLIILFIRGMLLDGKDKGIEFYITPQLDRLKDSGVWKDAAVQIFFSLSASWGGLIALSSYNRFHNDCLRDTITVAFGNCLTSLFAGFVIFSYLGNMAETLNVNVEDVAKSGPSLAFVVYPYAVTKLPVAPLWSIIFFLMLITLGVDSEFVLVETVITSLMDRFAKLRDYKFLTVVSVCVVFFLLGLTLTCEGGIYMLEIMDTYSGGWNILVIAICECISVGYVYGVFRFLRDLQCMTGKTVLFCFPFVFFKYWWVITWCFLTPIGCAFIMIFSWVDYKPLSESNAKYDSSSDVLGWLMTMVVILAIFGTAIYQLITTPGSFSERMRTLTNPTPEWGPALIKHRMEVAEYTTKIDPSFQVDPWNDGRGMSGNGLPVKQNYEMKEKATFDNKGYEAGYEARL